MNSQIMELVNSTSWGQERKGDKAITPAQITTGMLLNKSHVRRFMKRNEYEGLIPRMDLWCETVTIENIHYIKLEQLERITWPTFVSHLREFVDVELRVLPL